MKVVFVHHCGSSGGAGNSLFYLIQQLQKSYEIEVHILCPEGAMINKFKELTSNVYPIKGVQVEFSAEGFSLLHILYVNFKSYIWRKENSFIYSIIENIHPDIIHLNEIGMFSLARHIKSRTNIPVIMHARTVPKKNLFFLLNRFSSYCNRYVDELICISKNVFYLYPRVKNKRIIYNPIQLTKSNVNVNNDIDYYQKPLKILFLANLYKQKGIQEVLKLALLFKKRPEIEFTIVGSNTKSKRYFKSLFGRVLDILNIYPNYEKKIWNLKEKSQLMQLHYKGQKQNINNEIVSNHILLAPMHLNGTPRSVIEAGLFGLPSILSLKDKFDDLVENEVNGFVVGEKDVSAISEIILRLNEDRELLRKLGKSAKEKFIMVCNQEIIAKAVFDCYLVHKIIKKE